MGDTKIDNNIRVFVDEPIGNINSDEFGHRHYVDVIKNIIDNCQNEQLNIGLFGKWGVGKTTIINLVKNEIDNLKKYKTVLFGCWKYSNEPISLKRKFLLEVARQIGAPVDELIESLYIKGNRQISNQSILRSEDSLKKSIKEMFKGLLFSSVIVLFAEVIFYLLLFHRLNIEGQTSIPLFFNAIFAGVIYYVVKILRDYTSNVTITKSNENLESLEQFEKTFQKLINNFVKKNNKIIVFVDDLDRCQSKKVIEVLETIKAFINIKNCIFIIACDDEVLKDALIEEKINDLDYLDKIFQIKFTIPPFRQEKIRDYAIKLLSSIDIDVSDEELKEIVQVLIYKNDMSPRKVKILLNNFILLYEIFKERLQDNYISANFILDLKFLAKITVLQTEFTHLYYDLVNNNRLLEYIERVRRGDRDFEESQINILNKYYYEEEGEFRVKDGFRQTIEYLYYTSNYIVSREHIKTYIYLSQDVLNISYSDEYVENLENLMINKDINGFVNEVSKTKSQTERIEVFNNLLLRIDKYEALDMVNILSSLSNSNIVRLIPEDIKRRFASAILNKIQQYKHNIKHFDINGVESYINITERYDFYSDIIDEYVNSLTLDDLKYTSNVLNTICMNSNLSFNIKPLESFLVKLYEKNYEEVLGIIEKINDNQDSLEKYFSGDIFETIMDFTGEYSENDKEIISQYLSKISKKMIEKNYNLLTEKILNYINDSYPEISLTCIEIVDNIINSDKDISEYAENTLDALLLEINKWEDEDICNKIFNLMIRIGERYEINNESKEKIVARLCQYYMEGREVFVSSYINAVYEIARVYENIDRIVQNIVKVINSLNITNITSNSCKYLVNYINGVKEYINSTQRNTIIQSIMVLLNNQNIQINKSIMEFLYSLLKQCSFIIEPDKANELSNCLINIANAQNRGSNPVNEEIVKLTYTIYNELMYLFNVDSKNQYFSSILSKLESNLIYDFAVKQFIQNYKLLSDNNIRQRILSNIISKDCKEIDNNPQKIIEILIYYGNEAINQLLDAVFNFINRKFNMTDKINNLCKIIEELEFTNIDVELKILLSMYSIFEKEVQQNVFNNLLFNEKSVRENTVKLFIEGKIDNKYLYTLNTVSEKIDSEEERMSYYLLIEHKIKNSSSEIEINNLLRLFVALKDNSKYLAVNKMNNIINNTFIYLLEGGLPQKKAALDTLTLYYNQKKFPRGMGPKLAKTFNNIIKNDEEIKKKAIIVVINSGLHEMHNAYSNELKDTVDKYLKTGTED